MVQESHSVRDITDQKVAYFGNLHENIKEIHIYGLFGLKTINYL